MDVFKGQAESVLEGHDRGFTELEENVRKRHVQRSRTGTCEDGIAGEDSSADGSTGRPSCTGRGTLKRQSEVRSCAGTPRLERSPRMRVIGPV